MVADNLATQSTESLTAAKGCIQMGPVPGWVESCPFPSEFQDSMSGNVTYLLFDQQVHAELRQTYHHVALRLDTMQAVQIQSPWRLDFEPRRQQIVLHSIKTWRGETQFDHGNLAASRVVDREAAGSELQNRLTLLLMLEDLRPGDVLEWSYTTESRPILLPERCTSIFTLPTGAPVGKFYFSAIFDRSRAMQWKSSVPEWQPVKKKSKGDIQWIWTQEDYPGISPEQNMPEWIVAYPWIQISDCADWGMIGEAFAEAWRGKEDDSAVRAIAGEIAAGTSDLLLQTQKAIQMVQDEYRYLAADWELDGQPPLPIGMVVRRRYGDCKDLSFLLVEVLKRLGVSARLVLVSTVLRKSIADLLPAPGVFNHLVVEYQAGGETRWSDATSKRQGGGSLNGVILNYGMGLRIDGSSSTLIKSPGEPEHASIYDLNESILLDTSGAWSWLGVVVAARGGPAEELRQEVEQEGLEALAAKRLRRCVERFGKAKRIGALEYRDDRAANEFFLAEIYEIKSFLTLDPQSKWYKLDIANDYASNFLKMPERGQRRTPFALPHPCNIIHTIELHSVALPPAEIQQESVETGYVHFTRLRKTRAGCWTLKLTLSTLADAVPPESLEEHRKTIREIGAQSAWSILVPPGDPRPRERSDFAVLPLTWDPAVSMRATAEPHTPLNAQTPADPDNGAVPSPALDKSQAPAKSRRKHKHRKKSRKSRTQWRITIACALALLLIVLVFLAAKYADHWHIFKFRPKPPEPPINRGLVE